MGGREAVGAGPRLPLTFLPSSLGLSLQLLSSPLRNRRRQRPGSAVRAGGSFPPRAGPRVPRFNLLSVPRQAPTPPASSEQGMGRARGPRHRGPAGGRSRGPHPGHRPLPPSSPSRGTVRPSDRGCNGSPHAVLSSRPGHRPSAPARPSPRWAPRSLGGGPGVRGPSRFNGEAGGFRRAFTHPGGLAARNKGCGGVRDGGCRIGMRGTPKLNGGGAGGLE